MGTIYQVVHKQRFLLQEVRNVYYYETQDGEPTSSEWQDIIDEIRGDFVAELDAFSEEWTFYGIDYRVVSSPGLPSFSKVPTAGEWVGSGVNDPMVTQICALVSAKANSTKPNRVRTYYTGMMSTNIEDSLIGAGTRTAYETFFDLQSVLNAAGINELQRVSAEWNSTHTQVVDTNLVSGAEGVCSIVPATQRRRRIGVGI